MDYFLKFSNEAVATDVLEPFKTTHSIDIIGTIANETETLQGWHVNVRGIEDVVLDKYNVPVLTPIRIWA